MNINKKILVLVFSLFIFSIVGVYASYNGPVSIVDNSSHSSNFVGFDSLDGSSSNISYVNLDNEAVLRLDMSCYSNNNSLVYFMKSGESYNVYEPCNLTYVYSINPVFDCSQGSNNIGFNSLPFDSSYSSNSIVFFEVSNTGELNKEISFNNLSNNVDLNLNKYSDVCSLSSVAPENKPISFFTKFSCRIKSLFGASYNACIYGNNTLLTGNVVISKTPTKPSPVTGININNTKPSANNGVVSKTPSNTIYYNTSYYDNTTRKNVTIYIMIKDKDIYISNVSNFNDTNITLIKVPSNYTKDSYAKSKMSLTGISFIDAIIDFVSSIFNINLGGGYSIHGGTVLRDPRKSFYGIYLSKRF